MAGIFQKDISVDIPGTAMGGSIATARPIDTGAGTLALAKGIETVGTGLSSLFTQLNDKGAGPSAAYLEAEMNKAMVFENKLRAGTEQGTMSPSEKAAAREDFIGKLDPLVRDKYRLLVNKANGGPDVEEIAKRNVAKQAADDALNASVKADYAKDAIKYGANVYNADGTINDQLLTAFQLKKASSIQAGIAAMGRSAANFAMLPPEIQAQSLKQSEGAAIIIASDLTNKYNDLFREASTSGDLQAGVNVLNQFAKEKRDLLARPEFKNFALRNPNAAQQILGTLGTFEQAATKATMGDGGALGVAETTAKFMGAQARIQVNDATGGMSEVLNSLPKEAITRLVVQDSKLMDGVLNLLAKAGVATTPMTKGEAATMGEVVKTVPSDHPSAKIVYKSWINANNASSVNPANAVPVAKNLATMPKVEDSEDSQKALQTYKDMYKSALGRVAAQHEAELRDGGNISMENGQVVVIKRDGTKSDARDINDLNQVILNFNKANKVQGWNAKLEDEIRATLDKTQEVMTYRGPNPIKDMVQAVGSTEWLADMRAKGIKVTEVTK